MLFSVELNAEEVKDGSEKLKLVVVGVKFEYWRVFWSEGRITWFGA
jgi:hypothetical protein